MVQDHPEGIGGLAEVVAEQSESDAVGSGPKVKAPKSKNKEKQQQQVKLTRSLRGKKKCVVRVKGLEHFTESKLAECAKRLGKKFACGASLTEDAAGESEIDVQGDLMQGIAEFLCSEYFVPQEALKFVDKAKPKG